MFPFNFFKNKNKRKPSKAKWPNKPPKHNKDRQFLLNEYDALGIVQFITVDKEEISLFFVILMENGYGERYCNILKDGILIQDSSIIRNTDQWKNHISPWLNNSTDWLPKQSALMSAELSQKVIDLQKKFKSG